MSSVWRKSSKRASPISARHATHSDQASRIVVRVLILAFLAESASLTLIVSPEPTGRSSPEHSPAIVLPCYQYTNSDRRRLANRLPTLVTYGRSSTGSRGSLTWGCSTIEEICCSGSLRRADKLTSEGGRSFSVRVHDGDLELEIGTPAI